MSHSNHLQSSETHHMVCLVLPGVITFDLAMAYESFRLAQQGDGEPCYKISVCSEQPSVDTGPFTLNFNHDLSRLDSADTIIVPGIHLPHPPISADVRKTLSSAAKRGVRIASICSGAFVLAEVGLLDGLRATTHWLAAEQLQRQYPAIQVDPKVLFVDNGRVLTSAGAAAGMDLCLHMIRKDFGAAVASQVARLSVMPLQREGGQAQFIPPVHPTRERSLQPLLTWALANLHQPISLTSLAERAKTTSRTLHRRFQEELGESPKQWLIRSRVHRAQELLETSSFTVEQIVDLVGLGSAANFRQQFQRVVGVNPAQYRKNFKNN